ncbi:hypothetical protein IAU59_003537 [Kwoniella sp. CBS 9459]
MHIKLATVFAAVAYLADVKTAFASPVDRSSTSGLEARAERKELWNEATGPSPKDVKTKSKTSGWLATPLQRLADLNPQGIKNLYVDKQEDTDVGVTEVSMKFYEPDGKESLLKFNLTEPKNLIDQLDQANDYWWVPTVEYAGLIQGKYDGLNGEDWAVHEGDPADVMQMLMNLKYKNEDLSDNGANAKEWIEKSKDTAIFVRTSDRDLKSKDLAKNTWYCVVGFEKKNGNWDDAGSTITLTNPERDNPLPLKVPDVWDDLEAIVRPE